MGNVLAHLQNRYAESEAMLITLILLTERDLKQGGFASAANCYAMLLL